MKPLLRDSGVCGLMEIPAFAQKILYRVTTLTGVGRCRGHDTLDLRTNGCIPTHLLEKIRVVRIQANQSLVGRVNAAQSVDGHCRLFVNQWKVFINDDPHTPQLEPGIHLWIGLAWCHIPDSG